MFRQSPSSPSGDASTPDRRSSRSARPRVENLESRALMTLTTPIHQAASTVVSTMASFSNSIHGGSVATMTSQQEPTVTSVGTIRSRNGISGLVVSFSNGGGLSDAGNRAHYTVFTTTKSGGEKIQKVRTVMYEPASEVAAVFFAHKAPARQNFRLSIEGLLPDRSFSTFVLPGKRFK